MAIPRTPRFQNVYEPEDDFGADEAFLRNVVAPTPAPAPAPVAPAPFNPVGFDWATQGMQNIGGTIYQPQFESVQLGHGEEGGQYGPGALLNVLRYKEGQTAPGQTYEIIDPTTGKVTGTGKFKEGSKGFFGDLFRMVQQAAADLGPILQFTPLGPAVAAINAVTAAQQGNVLPLISSAAGFGGYSEIANAAKAVNALKNEDYLDAIVPGLTAAGVSDVGGFSTKDIGSAVNVAKAIESENPLALLGAAAKFAPKPDSQTAVGGGADPGYFDEQNEVIGLPAWAVDPYADSASLFPEFDAPLLTSEPVDNEMAKFLRQQELAQTGESPLGGMGLNAKELPLINLSGAPAPAPAAAPGKAPAPAAPKGSSFNPAALAAGLASLMGQQQQKPQEQYQLARTVPSPFGMDLIL